MLSSKLKIAIDARLPDVGQGGVSLKLTKAFPKLVSRIYPIVARLCLDDRQVYPPE